MEINLKDTLRTLRQKKNVTQEALAAHLGITQQSVGKWERGEGFPDITLLPRIALYFDVTVDDLLDVGKARIEEKIQAYMDEGRRLLRMKQNEENLALWEKAYGEFPNDCRVVNCLMLAIQLAVAQPYAKEDAERIIALGERILQESTDTAFRENAIMLLCAVYDSLGDEENALRYADMGGSIRSTREKLRAKVLKGNIGIGTCQSYLATLIFHAAQAAEEMVDKEGFSPEEKIVAYQFGIDLFNLLFPDGNMGLYAGNPSRSAFHMARSYAELGDAEKTLEALAESAKYAMIASTDQSVQLTAPLVNHLKIDPIIWASNMKGNYCNYILRGMDWNVFDFVREDERFRRIVEQLKQYAE
ncbi:MAG: helix-turn-helix transcriptional regulator [Oscillospiraceae bacterium]|nr:helix-turn-helix transcriptional regulator [Oscillospiraceae bacterium]